jgi:hypothetical protein
VTPPETPAAPLPHVPYERERDDGLVHCKVCGGAEASLPTHCPGERMSEETESDVQNGLTDYRDGQWVPT